MHCHSDTQPRFWEHLREHADAPALVDYCNGTTITYMQLAELVDRGAADLARSVKQLACLAISPDLQGIACYLSLLAAGYAVYLCGPRATATITDELIRHYRPDLVLWRSPTRPEALAELRYDERAGLYGHRAVCRMDSTDDLYPELAVLMSTSGSTGNAKIARLSYKNLAANAWQIVRALDLEPNERLALCLPLHYVYGLSVLHSALTSGAAMAIGGRTVAEPAFWDACRTNGVTALPTVPPMLKLIRSLPVQAWQTTGLKKLTVSGAAMDDATVGWLLAEMLPRRIQVYSMYGMTEACGRIAVLPAGEFAERPQSVGRAVSGGRLHVLDTGEIVYDGPNVMLGYAGERADLQREDVQGGALSTGDLGRLDAAGNLFISGRLNRICKVFGLRIDLTDVERVLATHGEVAVIGDADSIVVFHSATDETHLLRSTEELARRLRIPQDAFRLTRVDVLPMTQHGKVHYAALHRQ